MGIDGFVSVYGEIYAVEPVVWVVVAQEDEVRALEVNRRVFVGLPKTVFHPTVYFCQPEKP